MSTSCQPGSRVIGAFPDVEKPFLFSDLAVVKPPNQKINKTFQHQRRLGLAARIINFIHLVAGGIATTGRKSIGVQSFILRILSIFSSLICQMLALL